MKNSFKELGTKLKEILKLERESVAIKWSVREPRDIERNRGNPDSALNWIKQCRGRYFTPQLMKRNVWVV